MQKFALAALAAAIMTAVAPQLAFADQVDPAQAKLAVPLAQSKKVTIDGRDWRCEADTCKAGTQGTDQPAKRECGKLAKAVGQIASYQHGSKDLTADELATCNAAAK